MFGLFGKRSGKTVQSTRPEPTYEMSDSPVIGYVLLREAVRSSSKPHSIDNSAMCSSAIVIPRSVWGMVRAVSAMMYASLASVLA